MNAQPSPLAQLQAIAALDSLPARAAARCAALIERLQTPVRVAVFGLPGSGKTAVVHALAQTAVFRPGTLTAPVLLRFASRNDLSLTYADGHNETSPVTLPVRITPEAAFAEVALSLEPLRVMSLLCVVSDGSPADMAAGLAWAARRCDIAIWCTRDWSRAEQALWRGAPDNLKNHGFIVATGQSATVPEPPEGVPLLRCPTLSDAPGAALLIPSADALRRHLGEIIGEARAEDKDAAAWLIEKYGTLPVARPVTRTDPAPVQAPVETPAHPDLCGPADPAPQVVPAEARAVLSRLFHRTRQAARLVLTDGTGNVSADALLPAVQQTFDDLLDLAEDEPAFVESWPGLHTSLRDAGELTLLMGMEGGTAAGTDAAALLAQVRQDIETALAA
ncbi:hypothetical protein [Tropicibacter sp. S64]|uniref:hypothetical protein n=1 Tax=Tropicibacter sp. S64 TaxID=3415122 RepID=UPI003C7AFFFA